MAGFQVSIHGRFWVSPEELSVEEPDAAEPARPDLWGARVSNDLGLPDHEQAPGVLVETVSCGVMAEASPVGAATGRGGVRVDNRL